MSTDLIEQCIEAYWSQDHGLYGLHSAVRMKRAFEVIAAEIRTWAPDPVNAKLCHLAVNDVADRLLEHAANGSNPKSESASS